MFSQKLLSLNTSESEGTVFANDATTAYGYREVADSLGRLLAKSPNVDYDVSKHVLSAAFDLAQACEQCRTDADNYKKISDRATEVEKHLHEQLLFLLQLSGTTHLATGNLLNELGDSREEQGPDVDSGDATQAAQKNSRAERVLGHIKTCGTISDSCNQRRNVDNPVDTLTIYCLGTFRIFVNDRMVVDWPNSKSKSVFKYLITHRERPISKEVLMETFWSNSEPESSRNSLNVAICSVRKVLARFGSKRSFIKFMNGSYTIDAGVKVWIDSELFREICANARRLDSKKQHAEAVAQYQAAEALYQGDFLADDRYEDWPLESRQHMREEYIGLLTYLSNYGLSQGDQDLCVTACKKLIATDACNEEAHRRLMRCYAQRGQTHLAIRQFHFCIDALSKELALQPSFETVDLFQNIRRHHLV